MIIPYKIGRWLSCCLLFFITSCGAVSDKYLPPNSIAGVKEKLKIEEAFATIRQEKTTVKTGDLIMRTGNDFTSDVMRKLSLEDKTYSHCGIASLENDTLFVYHAMGGEWNPDKKIRRDPFILFCNPNENRGFGIFRYSLSDTQMVRFLSNITSYYQQGILFDMKFDLTTDDKMYCTEYIYKALDEIIPLPTTTINGITFVAPDNLYTISGCEPIKQIDFQ